MTAAEKMELRVAEPCRIAELRAFLERVGCTLELVDDATLIASIPRPHTADAARLELDLYLTLWEAVNPDAPVNAVA